MFNDFFDSFGAAHVKQDGSDIIITGIKTELLLRDMTEIWKNSRLTRNMFKLIRKHRLVLDQFFLPDIKYVLQQICEFKQRKSSKYRIRQILALIDTETWMKSTTEEHDDILDFSQLKNLKHTLFDHQINTLKVYNDKVPKMQLKGFLLSTPPGCLTGDTMITFKRNNETFDMFLAIAQTCYSQESTIFESWDLSIPIYVKAYHDGRFIFHEIHSIVSSGLQDVYCVKLEDGKVLYCTDTHPLLTEDGYIKAQDILGRKVICQDRHNYTQLGHSKAISYEYLGQEETYDIICKEPHHNFIANDIVVHNSGKTIMSIALSQCLHADLSIYIVPKNTVTTVWYDGITEELGPTARVWASSHDVPITTDYDHYIFHYEALPLAIYLAKQLAGKRTKPFIAIDESHNLNEITSVRTLRLVELTKLLNCQHTVFASGTPIKALGKETIPLLRCIDSFFNNDVEERFETIYGLTAKRANDILRNRLGLISHKIAEDSYMSAPKPIELDLAVAIPDARPYYISTIQAEMKTFMEQKYKFYKSNMKQYLDIYNRALIFYEKTLKTSQDRVALRTYKEYVQIIMTGYDPVAHKEEAKYCKEFEKTKIMPSLPQPLKTQFKDCISAVKYLKLKILGEALALVGKKRADCACEIMKHGKLEDIVTAADKKTIIFSSYIEALEIGYNQFLNKGFKPLRIYGQYTKFLTELVTKFKKDPELNPLFGTLQSLAASQTLTIANTVIFLNHPYREYIRDQAFHRVFRIGQDVQTYIYQCVLKSPNGEPNISTRTADILAWSQTQVEALVGSPDPQEMQGIVKKLHLNKTSSWDVLTDIINSITNK